MGRGQFTVREVPARFGARDARKARAASSPAQEDAPAVSIPGPRILRQSPQEPLLLGKARSELQRLARPVATLPPGVEGNAPHFPEGTKPPTDPSATARAGGHLEATAKPLVPVPARGRGRGR